MEKAQTLHSKYEPTPEHKVLYLRELLEEIFSKFADEKNVKALLLVRNVCRLWRAEAFFALRKVRTLLPAIHAGGYYFKKKYLQQFLTLCPRQCNLPLTFVIREWSPDVVNFLNTFDQEIVSLSIQIGYTWSGFRNNGREQFHLPGLKDSYLSIDREYMGLLSQWADSDVRAGFQLWTSITKSAAAIQNCTASIAIKDHQCNKSLLEFPRCVTELSFPMAISPRVDELGVLQYWPKLKKVTIRNMENMEGPFQSELILRQSSTLKQLELRGGIGDRIVEIGNMSSLEEIIIKGPSVTFQTNRHQILSRALPKLRTIKGMTNDTVLCLTKNSSPFQNVTDAKYFQDYNPRLGPDLMMATFVNYFPNVKNLDLEWPSSRVGAAAIVKVYSLMKNVESLSLKVADFTSIWDVNRLITGYSSKEVPCDTESWPTLLRGKQNCICNLKKLREFKFTAKEGFEAYAKINKEFVFKSAFARMATLFKVTLVNLRDEWGNHFKGQWIGNFPGKISYDPEAQSYYL